VSVQAERFISRKTPKYCETVGFVQREKRKTPKYCETVGFVQREKTFMLS
jgi:hypothetical protein